MLARTSCHSGKLALQSGRAESLYFACGLFERGQGESVVALRITNSSSVLSRSDPKVATSPFLHRAAPPAVSRLADHRHTCT